MIITREFCLQRIDEQNRYIKEIIGSYRSMERSIELVHSARQVRTYFETQLKLLGYAGK